MTFKIPPSIFREYDIRGIAGKDLSPEFAECLGKAYAQTLKNFMGSKELTISVGQDCRISSPAYASALISGLTQQGIHVVHLGICPTPLTYFSVFDRDLDGAIMVTG